MWKCPYASLCHEANGLEATVMIKLIIPHHKQALLDEQSMMCHSGSLTDRETDLVVCSFIPLHRNESLSEWLMMSFGKYKRNTHQIQKQPRTLTRRRTIGFLISHILMILFYYLVYIQFMQNFLDDERG